MRTLAQPHAHEEEIKRSRFIARAMRLDDAEEAPEAIALLSDPEATHNCWAWSVEGRYRSSDDGEPGGTAGRPILASLQGHGLDHVVVVVTRYYGGTKLGVGGLVRAYGGTASKCLDHATIVEVVPELSLCLVVPFDATGTLYNLTDRFGARRCEERWTQEGLEVDVLVQEDRADELEVALRDATRGRARVVREG